MGDSSPLELITPVAGFIDFWDCAYNTHLTGGNVDTWTGRTRGRTMTDGGVAGRRPAVNGDGSLAFTLVNSLQGFKADLNGKSQLSVAIAVQSSAAGANNDLLGQLNGSLCYLSGAAAVAATVWWVFTGGGFPAVEQFTETPGNHSLAAFHILIFQADYSAALLSITKKPRYDNTGIVGTIADQAGAATPTTMPNNDFILGASVTNGFGVTAANVKGIVVANALWGTSDINRVSRGMKMRFGTP